MSVSAIEYQFIARELAEKNAKYAVRSGFVLFSAGIEPPDAIDIAMSLTDDKYIDLISDNVFDKIIFR